jgi:hypothetical protein
LVFPSSNPVFTEFLSALLDVELLNHNQLNVTYLTVPLVGFWQ